MDPSTSDPGLKARVIKGASWTLSIRVFVNGIALLSQLILARLLMPEDFGLIAIAGSVAAILEVLGSFGFDLALIQRQTTNRDYYDSAWTLSLITAALISVLLVVLAGPTAAFFGDPRIEAIVYVFAATSFVKGFTNIGVVAFQKELRFDREFLYLVTQKLSSFLVAIPLAVIFKSYWALVIGIAAYWTAGVLLSYLLHPYRPRLCLTKCRQLLTFSRWLVINNVLTWVNNSGVAVIISRLTGIHEVGLYTISKQLAQVTARELVGPVGRAVYPGLAKVSGDHDRLRRGFLLSLSLLALTVFPAALGLAAVAEPLVIAFLGPKWAAAAPVLEILAIAGAVFVIQGNLESVFIAAGRPVFASITNSAATLVLLATLIPLLLYREFDVAIWAFVLAQGAAAVIGYLLLFAKTAIRCADSMRAIYRPVVAGVAMFIAVRYFDGWLTASTEATDLLRFVTGTCVGMASYPLLVLVLWLISGCPRGGETELYALVRRILGARRHTA